MSADEKSILRFFTAGSVDDGKSTLIGRLLFDSKAIFKDHLISLEKSKKSGQNRIDFSQLTDGLKAEREHGITIDVAYRYFSTSGRDFILADSPGHFEYTRNLATAASQCDVCILLVDASREITEQTRRHSLIAANFGITEFIVAINKMDLVDYSELVFSRIKNSVEGLFEKMGIQNAAFIPVSALHGDNLVSPSAKMSWYLGSSLLSHLEKSKAHDRAPLRFVIQYVAKGENRSYLGQLLSGSISVNDEVLALPSNRKSKIKSMHLGSQPLETASFPQSIGITLSNELDLGRGDLLASADVEPSLSTQFVARLFWMGSSP